MSAATAGGPAHAPGARSNWPHRAGRPSECDCTIPGCGRASPETRPRRPSWPPPRSRTSPKPVMTIVGRLDAAGEHFLLQLQAAHARHPHIQHQTARDRGARRLRGTRRRIGRQEPAGPRARRFLSGPRSPRIVIDEKHGGVRYSQRKSFMVGSSVELETPYLKTKSHLSDWVLTGGAVVPLQMPLGPHLLFTTASSLRCTSSRHFGVDHSGLYLPWLSA